MNKTGEAADRIGRKTNTQKKRNKMLYIINNLDLILLLLVGALVIWSIR